VRGPARGLDRPAFRCGAAGPGPVVAAAPCLTLCAAHRGEPLSAGIGWPAATGAGFVLRTVVTQRGESACARPRQGARLPSWAGPGSACWLPGWLPAGADREFPCPIGTAQHAGLRERWVLPSRRCTISCSPASDQRPNTETSKCPLNCENVELRGLEPLASCMPSAGNTSTRVRSRRSSSYSVRSSPPRSGSVAVLLCCTAQHERRPPSRHVISPPAAPLGIAAETVPPRSASRQTSVTSLTGWPVTAATVW
jgi:hypothetical protein